MAESYIGYKGEALFTRAACGLEEWKWKGKSLGELTDIEFLQAHGLTKKRLEEKERVNKNYAVLPMSAKKVTEFYTLLMSALDDEKKRRGL